MAVQGARSRSGAPAFSRPRLAAALALPVLLLAAAFVTPRPASAQAAEARVRVVHASPDAPDVDVFVDGARAIEGLAFGTATDFVSPPAGDYDVDVAPAGADIADAVISATLTLEAGVSYDVAAIGFVADIAAQVAVVDTGALGPDEVRVRVVHASPDAPAVDVGLAGGGAVFGGLEFPTVGDYAALPAGTYDLEVRLAGGDDVVLPLSGLALTAGTVYDVYAIGSVEAGTFTVLPLTATAATSTLPAVMAMPSTGSGSAVPDSSSGLIWLAASALVLVGLVGTRAVGRMRA